MYIVVEAEHQYPIYNIREIKCTGNVLYCNNRTTIKAHV